MEEDPKFTVIVGIDGIANYYLDGIPLTNEEVDTCHDRYGPPEWVEEEF